MGWKTINGRRYYYQSVREGDRVRSVYYGGELGELADAMARLDREEKLLQRTKEREWREELDAIDRELDELTAEARRLAERALNLTGFWQHKRGEWRKRRG